MTSEAKAVDCVSSSPALVTLISPIPRGFRPGDVNRRIVIPAMLAVSTVPRIGFNTGPCSDPHVTYDKALMLSIEQHFSLPVEAEPGMPPFQL